MTEVRTPNRLFHYSHSQNIDQIIESGCLRVEQTLSFEDAVTEYKNIGYKTSYAKKLAKDYLKQLKDEVPLLWASTNPLWENTVLSGALKGARGEINKLNSLLASDICPVRFDVPCESFVKADIETLCKLGKRSKASVRNLFDIAEDVEANPDHWYVTTRNIGLPRVC